MGSKQTNLEHLAVLPTIVTSCFSAVQMAILHLETSVLLCGEISHHKAKIIFNRHRPTRTTSSTDLDESIKNNLHHNYFITVIRSVILRICAKNMAPRDTSQDRISTPDPVEKGIATLSTLRYVLNLDLSMSHSSKELNKSLT